MKKIGRYEVIEELGRGAMGVVYKASDPTIGRMVAVKVLTLDDKPEEGTLSPRDTFLREARAAGRLSHHGIVTIHDALEDESTHSSYIVMEFIPGRTLEKILLANPLTETEKTFDIIRQVAEALDYAHRNQIIHRDLKPANIILTEDGRAKITDFGIAKIAAAGAMRTVAIMGTPSYMSPEQVTGGEIDARADLFSLGILLYLMLVGEKPFVGDTAAVMFKIVYEDPVLPSKVNPKLTAGDDYVILRCLAKDRVKRYSSAKEFLEDLDDLRRGRPPRSQARMAPSEFQAAERTVAAAHPLIPLRPAPSAPNESPSAQGVPQPKPTPIAAPLPAPPPPTTSAQPVALRVAAPALATPVAAASAVPAQKKSSASVVAVALVVAVAIGAAVWSSRKPAVPGAPPVTSAVPAPPETATAPTPPPLVPATTASPNPPATSRPVAADTTKPIPNKRIAKAPEPSPKPAPAAKFPIPATAPVDVSKLTAAASQPAPAPVVSRVAKPNPGAVSDITVYCKHDFEQATLMMLEGSKLIYQARLVGKKKKGFIGIGGKGYSGEFAESATIPANAGELIVRVYSDDGKVNLQNTVSARPPSSDSTTLRVTPAKDQLKLEWAKTKK